MGEPSGTVEVGVRVQLVEDEVDALESWLRQWVDDSKRWTASAERHLASLEQLREILGQDQ